MNNDSRSRAVRAWSGQLIEIWNAQQADSFLAFEALLNLLKAILDPSADNYYQFRCLMEEFSSEAAVRFLRESLSQLIDDDFLQHTDCIDQLLLYLSQLLINTESPLLRHFAQETPHFGGFYLRKHGKQFEELNAYILNNEKRCYDEASQCLSVQITPHYLTSMQFAPRKVIVSNAPPIKLKRRRQLTSDGVTKFDCEQSAGGLVSGVRPSLAPDDIWVAYLESRLLNLDCLPRHLVPRLVKEGPKVAPRFRRSTSVLRYSLSEEPPDFADESAENAFLYGQAENDFMSLQSRLRRFAEKNFIVNPLILMKCDHRPFYDGVANGLFWPAFHDLPEYIAREYRELGGLEQLEGDWQKYIKVNFHFAIHAARACRDQDFIWIHDYHLFLVGIILRSLDPNLTSGFFLHIPFRLSNEFMKQFPVQGLLGFDKVGFQSNKDTLNFIHLLNTHLPQCAVNLRPQFESPVYAITHELGICNVGSFPISVNPEQLLVTARSLTNSDVQVLRQEIMGERKGKLFLSVERFDYTKGIMERLDAIQLYFEQNPASRCEDVFYQVAATSRAEISSYKQYQKTVLHRVQEINDKYSQNIDQPCILIDQANNPQEKVIELFKAADVIVVTPLADGMNLVIKEAILSNPNAVFILSTGSGAENQLFDAGLGGCYLRLEDVTDTKMFAELLQTAISIPADVSAASGKKLFDFTSKHDIDHWIQSFMSPTWTHMVVSQGDVTSKQALVERMHLLQSLRRQTVCRITNSQHVAPEVVESLSNIRLGLEKLHQESLKAVLEDVKMDVKVLEAFWKGGNMEDWCEIFSAAEILLKNGYKLPRDSTDVAILDFDSFLTECNVENVGSLQSLTDGFLLHRFLSRFASHVVFITEHFLDDSNLWRLAFPEDFGTFCGMNELESVLPVMMPATTTTIFGSEGFSGKCAQQSEKLQMCEIETVDCMAKGAFRNAILPIILKTVFITNI